ncbi:MAG: hypothetical protein ABS896_06215 [Carnobacterium inhibens]
MSKPSSLNVTPMDNSTKYNPVGSAHTTMYTQETVLTVKEG